MKILMIGLIGAVWIFLGCLLGTAIGAMVGAMAGLVFDGSLSLLGHALGIPHAEPYQLGAIFGFVGSFFSPTIRASK